MRNLLARSFWLAGTAEADMRYIKLGDNLIRYTAPNSYLTVADVDAGTVSKRLGATKFQDVYASTAFFDPRNADMIGFAGMRNDPSYSGLVKNICQTIYPQNGVAANANQVQPFWVFGSMQAREPERVWLDAVATFKTYARQKLSPVADTTESVGPESTFHKGGLYLRGLPGPGGVTRSVQFDTSVLSASSDYEIVEPRPGYGDSLARNVFNVDQGYYNGSATATSISVGGQSLAHTIHSSTGGWRSRMGLPSFGTWTARRFPLLSTSAGMDVPILAGVHKSVKTVKLKAGSGTDAEWILLNFTKAEVIALVTAMLAKVDDSQKPGIQSMLSGLQGLAATSVVKVWCFDTAQERVDVYDCQMVKQALSDGAERADVDAATIGAVTLAQARERASIATRTNTWIWVDDQVERLTGAVVATGTGTSVPPYFTYTQSGGAALDSSKPYFLSGATIEYVRSQKPLVYTDDMAVLADVKARTGVEVSMASSVHAVTSKANLSVYQPWLDKPLAWLKHTSAPSLQPLGYVLRAGVMENAAAFGL